MELKTLDVALNICDLEFAKWGKYTDNAFSFLSNYKANTFMSVYPKRVKPYVIRQVVIYTFESFHLYQHFVSATLDMPGTVVSGAFFAKGTESHDCCLPRL